MNIIIRNVSPTVEPLINKLKIELSIKTSSKLLIACVKSYESLKMISKQKDLELQSLRSQLFKLENFKTEVTEVLDYESYSLEDVKHTLSNSLYDLNNDSDYDDSDFF